MLNKYIESESNTREWIKHSHLCSFLLSIWHLPQGCNSVHFIFVLIRFHFLFSRRRNVRLQRFVFASSLSSSPAAWLLPCGKTCKSPLTLHFHSSIFINSILGKVAWCFSTPLPEDPWGDPLHPPPSPPTRWMGSHLSTEARGETASSCKAAPCFAFLFKRC